MSAATAAVPHKHVIPMKALRDFILDIVMIAKNRGLTYREGMAGMAASVRLMKSLRAGTVYGEQEYIERIEYLVRGELARTIPYRLVWDHGELGVELLSEDLTFVRVKGITGDLSLSMLRDETAASVKQLENFDQAESVAERLSARMNKEGGQ